MASPTLGREIEKSGVRNVFKIDANRYQVIVDSGIKTIKLS